MGTFRGPNIDSDHTTLSQPSSDCALAPRGLRALVHNDSWTSRNCGHKGQLRRCPLNSQISSVVPHLISATLVDCGPTSPTPYAFLRKQSLVFSAHPNEISGTMRSVRKQLQQKTLHTKNVAVENYREKRKAFSDARRGRKKGVSVKKSRCIDIVMTLENSIKRLSV